jgi:hypothetical protein
MRCVFSQVRGGFAMTLALVLRPGRQSHRPHRRRTVRVRSPSSQVEPEEQHTMANTTQSHQNYQYSDLGAHAAPQSAQTDRSPQAFNQNVMQFLKNRPGAALLGAMAAGFLVGRIFAHKDK